MALMTGDSKVLHAALRDAFGDEVNQYRRVVIDIQVGHVVVVHIERFADERLLDVVRTLDGVEIRTSPPLESDKKG